MKGILFNPWKIKAIAESSPDREWQTRRIGGLDILNRETDFADQPNSPDEYSLLGFDGKGADFSRYAGSQGGMSIGIIYHLKPRYLSGETVYIKEWVRILQGYSDWGVVYNDSSQKTIYPPNEWINIHAGEIELFRTARTCPAWAARYFIKITGVEACRTKDITIEDCEAEGITTYLDSYTYPGAEDMFESSSAAYFALYDSINGKGAHERNWDFKYSFKRVEKEAL